MKGKLNDLSVSVRLLILGLLIFSLAYSGVIGAVGQVLWNDSAEGSLMRENGKIVGSELIGQKFDDPKYFHSRPSSIDYDAMRSGSQNLAPQTGALFSVDLDGVKDRLNQGVIPDKLRSKFEKRGYALPDDATIIKEKDNQWRIKSEDEQLYTLKAGKEELEIYKKSELTKRVENLLKSFSGGYNRSEVPSILVTESGSALDPHITVRSALFQIPRISRNTGIQEDRLRSLVENYSQGKLLGLYGMKRVNVLKLNLELNRIIKGNQVA